MLQTMIGDAKSAQKKKLQEMKIILFILYFVGVGWSAFFNVIWFTENQLTTEEADIVVLTTLCVSLLIYCLCSYYYCRNIKKLVQYLVAIDKLFISCTAAVYSFNVMINSFKDALTQQSDQDQDQDQGPQDFYILTAAQSMFSIGLYMMTCSSRIMIKQVSWKTWHLLSLKLLLTSASIYFIFLNQSLKNDKNYGTEVPVYSVSLTIYYTLIFAQLSVVKPSQQKVVGKLQKIFKKIVDFFTKDPDSDIEEQVEQSEQVSVQMQMVNPES